MLWFRNQCGDLSGSRCFLGASVIHKSTSRSGLTDIWRRKSKNLNWVFAADFWTWLAWGHRELAVFIWIIFYLEHCFMFISLEYVILISPLRKEGRELESPWVEVFHCMQTAWGSVLLWLKIISGIGARMTLAHVLSTCWWCSKALKIEEVTAAVLRL